MGHITNPDGSLDFNNSPSTTADLIAMSERVEELGGTSVPTVAALETIENPREGETRLVLADGSTWRRLNGGWRLTTYAASGRGGTVALETSTLTPLITITLPANAPAGKYLVMFDVTTGAGAVGQHYQRVMWGATEITSYLTDYLNQVPAGSDVNKSDTLLMPNHAGGAVQVVLQVQVNAAAAASRSSRLTILYVGP